MKQTQVIVKLQKEILKNAALLKQSDLMISDRARLTASSLTKAKVRALYKAEGGKVTVRCKHYNEMPYHPLPNASVYSIMKKPFNWISALFGVQERVNGVGPEILNWRNNMANNYVRYIFNLLGHLRDAKIAGEYWRVAHLLLKNKGFQRMALNHVCPGWHMSKNEGEVARILESLKSIILEKRVSIPMQRVYIPKANGKWRPLGVPEVSWRIYLHMWNCLIVWWRQGKDRNHAYFPSKGIHTAWQELLPKLIKSENVYEFDLKSFFPSVNISEIEKLMVEKLDIPVGIARYLMDMHRSITKIPREQKLDESNDLNVLLTPSNQVNPNLGSPLKEKVLKALSLEEPHRNKALKSLLPSGWSVYRTHGVPQGTATSCGVATISLHYIWNLLGDKLVMYADDGILFPSEESEIKNLCDENRGITPNMDKSGWVKKAGLWTKESVKFLGLRFYPSSLGDHRIASSTRNGGELEYSLAAQLLTYLKIEWDQVVSETMGLKIQTLNLNSTYSPYNLIKVKTVRTSKPRAIINPRNQTVEEWLKGKITDFAALPTQKRLELLFSQRGLKTLAEMFNGEWGIPSYEQTRQYVVGSWLHVHGGRFLYEEVLGNWPEHLTIYYWKRIHGLNLTVSLPDDPHSIWTVEWWSGLVGKELKKALKLEAEMSSIFSMLKSKESTPSFVTTLNSLFKWNVPKEISPIDWQLRRAMAKLLRGFPFDLDSLSSMAISDSLSRGICADREIRSCIAIKTKGKLVSHIPRDQSPRKCSKLGALKDFKRSYDIDFQRLIPILSQ